MPDIRPFSNAAKAFTVREDGCMLVLKRRANDDHKPGSWDLPGGRLRPDEHPYAGAHRECEEETGLDVDVGQVIDVHHFTRDDGQVITMMIFACTPKMFDVRSSEEHVEYRWIPLAEAGALCPEWLPPIVGKYERWMRGA